MDVYDNGQWGVGGDRAIGQNADRLGAKRTLDINLVGGDIGKVRFRHGPGQLEARWRGAASKTPRPAAAIAGRAHRATRDRQVRLCSWMVAAPVCGQAKR